MYLLLKMVIFHCHVILLEGIWYGSSVAPTNGKKASSLLNKGPIRTFTFHYYRSKLYSCIYHRSKLSSYVYFELFLSTQYFKLILHEYFSGSFTQLLHPKFPLVPRAVERLGILGDLLYYLWCRATESRKDSLVGRKGGWGWCFKKGPDGSCMNIHDWKAKRYIHCVSMI